MIAALPALVAAFAPTARLAPRVTAAVKPLATPVVAPLAASRAAAPAMITGLEGPALVTAAHVILAYNLMPLGPTAYGLGMGGKKMSAGQARWGDRAFGNTMEQFPLFNAALWLHAVFVSPAVATKLGVVYLCLRLMYPVLWLVFGGEGGPPFKPYSVVPLFGPLKQIYYSTFPQYGIVFYLAFATVLKLAFGLCLNTIVGMPALVAPIGFGYFLYHYAYVLYPLLHENFFVNFFDKA